MRRETGGVALVFGALSPAHAQRPGRPLSGRRGGLPRGHRRHRHGAQPRHRPRGVHEPQQVRRRRARAPCGPTRSRRWRGGRAATSGTARSAPRRSSAISSRVSWRASRPTASRRSPRVFWRNSELDFSSPAALMREPRGAPASARACARARGPTTTTRSPRWPPTLTWPRGWQPGDVRLLVGGGPGAGLPGRDHGGPHSPAPEVFLHLVGLGAAAARGLGRATGAAPRPREGDTEALLARIAAIRTWTYIAHRPGWLADPEHWQERTRAIEDRLSDALHERLTEQFVDRRATVIARQDKGELMVEVARGRRGAGAGPAAGRLEGFRFHPDPSCGRRPVAFSPRPTAACAPASASRSAPARTRRTRRSAFPRRAGSSGVGAHWAACCPATRGLAPGGGAAFGSPRPLSARGRAAAARGIRGPSARALPRAPSRLARRSPAGSRARPGLYLDRGAGHDSAAGRGGAAARSHPGGPPAALSPGRDPRTSRRVPGRPPPARGHPAAREPRRVTARPAERSIARRRSFASRGSGRLAVPRGLRIPAMGPRLLRADVLHRLSAEMTRAASAGAFRPIPRRWPAWPALRRTSAACFAPWGTSSAAGVSSPPAGARDAAVRRAGPETRPPQRRRAGR